MSSRRLVERNPSDAAGHLFHQAVFHQALYQALVLWSPALFPAPLVPLPVARVEDQRHERASIAWRFGSTTSACSHLCFTFGNGGSRPRRPTGSSGPSIGDSIGFPPTAGRPTAR